MNPIAHRIHPDPRDPRRLLLDDGRPVLSVIGGGHERPFAPQELATISAWACECWNAASIAESPRLPNVGALPDRSTLLPLNNGREVDLGGRRSTPK